MSSHATSSRSDEVSTVHHRNVSREREIVYRIIESAERPRRHRCEHWEDRYGSREKWEVLAIILLLLATHILLALVGLIMSAVSGQLIHVMTPIFDLFVAWGNVILDYMSTWVQGFSTWKWLW